MRKLISIIALVSLLFPKAVQISGPIQIFFIFPFHLFKDLAFSRRISISVSLGLALSIGYILGGWILFFDIDYFSSQFLSFLLLFAFYTTVGSFFLFGKWSSLCNLFLLVNFAYWAFVLLGLIQDDTGPSKALWTTAIFVIYGFVGACTASMELFLSFKKRSMNTLRKTD